MSPEELHSLRSGDKIRHRTSSHILRIIKVEFHAETAELIATVERNFTLRIDPIEDWLIASQPRLA